jgi:hypothetical protein
LHGSTNTSILGTRHALIVGLNRDTETFKACREVLCGAGEPLLLRAQKAGEARIDAGIDDVMRLITGVT